MKAMTIGQLARRAGVGVQTIRYYERRRLLPPASRRESGYREFPPAALGRLRFIRRARELGFTLAEIADLLPASEAWVILASVPVFCQV
jgi:MerR family copper efflux transcriptional regulator